ncbi:MAG: hypothetical protein M3169_03385 [Candidatus Eremiobacteraeota bacterium]|nr:hypothetical protein [Candidatus Eremiobacteraeota bacterium]
MRIFDVPKLDEKTAWERVRATLDRYPSLQRVYDDETLANLIRRRQALTNHLLFWLALPVDDERSIAFWSAVAADLLTLEASGAFDSFRKKMRLEEKERMTSWRTELWFAAWLVRNGITLTLEPAVGDNHPEFVTDTTPPTWWEIKSPLDLEPQRVERAVLTDVQRRLLEIPEPYVLNLVKVHLALSEVPQAVKEIRAQIRAFAQQNGELPARFESPGLVISAIARTKHRATGFLGTVFSGHLFKNEHAQQAADKIASAIPQLPEDGAGIVVVDRTLSDWSDEDSVIDACYGESAIAVLNGDSFFTRGEGFFRPEMGTRISAVVSYSHHPRHSEEEGGYELLFLHNPHASIPLPEDLFRFPGVRHTRVVNLPDGSSQLKTTGEGIAESETQEGDEFTSAAQSAAFGV